MLGRIVSEMLFLFMLLGETLSLAVVVAYFKFQTKVSLTSALDDGLITQLTHC